MEIVEITQVKKILSSVAVVKGSDDKYALARLNLDEDVESIFFNFLEMPVPDPAGNWIALDTDIERVIKLSDRGNVSEIEGKFIYSTISLYDDSIDWLESHIDEIQLLADCLSEEILKELYEETDYKLLKGIEGSSASISLYNLAADNVSLMLKDS